jgi:integrase
VRAILNLADEEWRSMILFGLYTGQRLGDIASLRWNNVDLQIMRSWELNPRVNQHGFKSLFRGLFSMKRDLISQDGRLILPELSVREIALGVE